MNSISFCSKLATVLFCLSPDIANDDHTCLFNILFSMKKQQKLVIYFYFSDVCNFKSFSFLNELSQEAGIGLEMQGIDHRMIFYSAFMHLLRPLLLLSLIFALESDFLAKLRQNLLSIKLNQVSMRICLRDINLRTFLFNSRLIPSFQLNSFRNGIDLKMTTSIPVK